MSIEIELVAGDVVYWLSSKGFSKGYIKRIYYSEEINIETRKTSKDHFYFLKSDKDMGPYVGDQVAPHLVFTDYDSMIEYYKKQTP